MQDEAKELPGLPGTVAPEPKEYEVEGQMIARQAKGLVVKCPHVDDEGTKCEGIVSTIGIAVDPVTQEQVLKSDERLVAAWAQGTEITGLVCGMCGSKLKLRRGVIIKPNQGLNRHQRRAHLKLVE